jgi:hypothetical protein
LPAAGDAFARSRSAWLSLDRLPLVTEATAGLAEVALRQGDLAEALANAESVLHSMAEGAFDGADESFRIYLTCYRVLAAHADPRARPLLEQAHDLLSRQAGSLAGEESRAAFLHNVPAHRDIMALWEKST